MRFAGLRALSRRHLAAAVLLCALAIMAAAAIYTYRAYQTAASDLIVERDRQLVYLTAARLHEEFVRLADDLSAVALAVDGLARTQDPQQPVLARARSRLSRFDGGVILLDETGRVSDAEPARPDLINEDWSQRSFFRQLVPGERVHVSDAAHDGPGGADAVALSVPVSGRNGELAGAVVGLLLVGSANTDDLFAAMLQQAFDNTRDVHLIDGNRRVIFDLAHRASAYPPRLAALPIGTSGALGAWRTRDEDGRDVVSAHAAIPGTSWTLVIVDDWSTLSATARNYANRLLALLSLGIIVAPFTVALLVRDQQRQTRLHELRAQETRVAGMIHDMMLPRQLPTLAGWDVAIRQAPAPSGRRAFHDYLFRPDGQLALAIGEVDERGLLGAHIISTVRAALRGAAHRELPPHEALQCSNTLLCPEMTEGVSLRCLYAIISPDAGQVHYAGAGIGAPLVCGAAAPNAHAVDAPLGQALASRYDEHTVELQPGQRLVLCTPGLLACRNDRRDEFGVARLSAALGGEGTAQQAADALVAALESFAGDAASLDHDVVVVVLQRCRSVSAGNGRPA